MTAPEGSTPLKLSWEFQKRARGSIVYLGEFFPETSYSKVNYWTAAGFDVRNKAARTLTATAHAEETFLHPFSCKRMPELQAYHLRVALASEIGGEIVYPFNVPYTTNRPESLGRAYEITSGIAEAHVLLLSEDLYNGGFDVGFTGSKQASTINRLTKTIPKIKRLALHNGSLSQSYGQALRMLSMLSDSLSVLEGKESNGSWNEVLDKSRAIQEVLEEIGHGYFLEGNGRKNTEMVFDPGKAVRSFSRWCLVNRGVLSSHKNREDLEDCILNWELSKHFLPTPPERSTIETFHTFVRVLTNHGPPEYLLSFLNILQPLTITRITLSSRSGENWVFLPSEARFAFASAYAPYSNSRNCPMLRNFQSRIEILRDYSVHGRIDSEIFLKEAGKFVIEFLSEVVTDKGSCCEVHEHVYRMEASLRSGWEKLGTTNWREILASYSDYVDGWLRLQEEYVRSLDAWYFEGVEANHPRKLT